MPIYRVIHESSETAAEAISLLTSAVEACEGWKAQGGVALCFDGRQYHAAQAIEPQRHDRAPVAALRTPRASDHPATAPVTPPRPMTLPQGHASRPPTIPVEKEEPTTVDAEFHHLWSNAVGKPGYEKRTWLELERLLHRAQRKGLGPSLGVRLAEGGGRLYEEGEVNVALLRRDAQATERALEWAAFQVWWWAKQYSVGPTEREIMSDLAQQIKDGRENSVKVAQDSQIPSPGFSPKLHRAAPNAAEDQVRANERYRAAEACEYLATRGAPRATIDTLKNIILGLPFDELAELEGSTK